VTCTTSNPPVDGVRSPHHLFPKRGFCDRLYNRLGAAKSAEQEILSVSRRGCQNSRTMCTFMCTTGPCRPYQQSLVFAAQSGLCVGRAASLWPGGRCGGDRGACSA